MIKGILKNFSRKKVGWGALILLLLIQVFSIDKTNPPADPQDDFMTLTAPPVEIKTILKNACYDCHSNHTEYPWYTNIEPVSWWVKGHIKNGRRQVNFLNGDNTMTKEKFTP